MKVKEICGLGSLLGVVGVVFFGGCLGGFCLRGRGGGR